MKIIDLSMVCALQKELSENLTSSRVEKIQQPAKDLIIFTVRRDGENKKILISAAAGKARIHFTDLDFENPDQSPMFCMLLRKHILSYRIIEVSQPQSDRIISLLLSGLDEIGRVTHYTLIVEMISRCPNIILVDANGLIVDCIFRKEYEPDLYRRVYPGMIYRQPRLRLSDSEIKEIKLPEPFKSVSSYLDYEYSLIEKKELYLRKSKELRNLISSSKKRIEKKLSVQRNDLESSLHRDEIRKEADLIVANIWRIKKGDDVLRCEDFYSEDNPSVTIRLDPLLSPQNYAAKLYKEYNRKKKAQEYLVDLIQKGEDQLDYLASVQDLLERASSFSEIDSIKAELISTGFVRHFNNSSKKKNKTDTSQKPIVIRTDDGYEIYIGKNNIENDYLTFKNARKSDYWFHVKSFHGSHVILKTGGCEPSSDAIEMAAQYASDYSQVKGMPNCPVDFTQIKNVKKPVGAMPGKVIYTNYKTVFVKNNR